MPDSTNATAEQRRARCPICGAARSVAFRPFCSRGCRDRDLIGWFSDDYRVPVTTPPEPGELDASTQDAFRDESD